MLKEKLNAIIDDMDISDLIYLHNNYCDAVNGFDDYIYSMDDFNELCNGLDAHQIACRIFYGDFNPNDDYVAFNGYANFISFTDYAVSRQIYTDDIIDYIIDKNDSLYNDDIQELLDEYEREGDTE